MRISRTGPLAFSKDAFQASVRFSRLTPMHSAHRVAARTHGRMNASSQNARPRLRNRIFLRLRRRSWHSPLALSFRNSLPFRDSSATSMRERTGLREVYYARCITGARNST